MPITIVVGGQFGSEGKGKVTQYFGKDADWVVRVGGPNSGHSVVDEYKNLHIFRQLPSIARGIHGKCYIAAGSYINEDLLLYEMKKYDMHPGKLYISPHAALISKEYIDYEKRWHYNDRLGSTETGVGATVLKRVQRNEGDVKFVTDTKYDEIRDCIDNYGYTLQDEIIRGKRIVIEGTQGFGLSNLHSMYYPYVTARDTTAAGFLSEAGLSPLDVDRIILVIRTYPIRVAGNSGFLPHETTWKELNLPQEITSVTKKVRRVGEFEGSLVRKAIMVNKPTDIVLNHFDYCLRNSNITDKLACFYHFEKVIDHEINYIGLGPNKIIKSTELEKYLSDNTITKTE